MRRFWKGPEMPSPGSAPTGRTAEMPLPSTHHALGTPLVYGGDDAERIIFGLGCFWGAERLFWQTGGVLTTAVGYAGGHTTNPTYEEVCSGRTGHNEVVLVTFNPAQVSVEALLAVFFEGHDPTQGMRQGNDVGTQYRSGIYCTTEAQRSIAETLRARYDEQLQAARHGATTTEIIFPAPPFYYAEEYHQQYLSKNPNGYCGLGGTGVACPIGNGVSGLDPTG